MKLFKRRAKEPEQPWPEGLPMPYQEGRIIPLRNFLHGSELAARRERNREGRRKWAEDYLGIEGRD
jgi:hypothetical protein